MMKFLSSEIKVGFKIGIYYVVKGVICGDYKLQTCIYWCQCTVQSVNVKHGLYLLTRHQKLKSKLNITAIKSCYSFLPELLLLPPNKDPAIFSVIQTVVS